MSASAPWATLSLPQKAVALFAVSVGIPVFLQSHWLTMLTGRSYVGPVALGFLPLPPQQHHLALLVVGFGLWLANSKRMATVADPSQRSRWVSGALVVLASYVAFLVTHPSAEQAAQLKALSMTSGLLFTALSYLCLLLPAVAAYGLLFPWQSAKECFTPLLACLLLACGFVATGIVSTVWHLQLVTPALELGAWLLRFIDPSAVSVDATHALLTFREFTVRMGPQCAAVDGVMLFVLLAAALWWQHSRKQAMRAVVATVIGAALLFGLNGVRIAMIMVIGTFSRELAVDLFHGLIGIAMLIVLLWLFDRFGMARKHA